jgi:hypothetical protein
MVHWKMILFRILRRIRYVFVLNDLLIWEYESCQRCGHCFRICWSVKDEIWKKVMNVTDDGGGSLCVDCFVELACAKNIEIKDEDIRLELFLPE